MKRLYLTPGGVLSATPGVATPGSLFVGEHLDFTYPFSSQEVFASGGLSLNILTNASGDIELSPTLIIRDHSGTNVLETQVWAGIRKLAGVGTILEWDGEQHSQEGLAQTEIVLRLTATGTTGASATLGVGTDAYIDLDIRQGTPVQQDIYTRGIFYLFKRRESRIIWTRGDVRQHVERDIYTEATYHATVDQDFYTRGDVRRRDTLNVFTQGDVFDVPAPGDPAIKDLRMGKYALSSSSKVVDTESTKDRLDRMIPVPGPTVIPTIPELSPTSEPIAKAAESLISASEFLRAEDIPAVPGNFVEVYYPSHPADSDIVLVDGEWRLPVDYNTIVTYELPLVSHTTQTSLRLLLLGLRQKPTSALLTAEMNGVFGKLILQKDVSPSEEFLVWAWLDPVPRATVPYFFPIIGVTNPTGASPGFRGTAAAILVA